MSDSTIVPTKAEKLLKPMARRVAISQARLFVSSHLLPLGVLCLADGLVWRGRRARTRRFQLFHMRLQGRDFGLLAPRQPPR